MCSIMGYCDCCDTYYDFKKGFDKTISRGPDDSRIIDTGKGLLGFHRLTYDKKDLNSQRENALKFKNHSQQKNSKNALNSQDKFTQKQSQKNTNLRAAPTVRFFSRCTGNTAPVCSLCLTPNLPL